MSASWSRVESRPWPASIGTGKVLLLSSIITAHRGAVADLRPTLPCR
jgi:hypothetical protein